MDQHLQQEFKVLILDGYYNAQSTHSAIFPDKGTKGISVIIGYLAIANSYINAAKAVYVCNEILGRQEFDEFFNEFKFFSDEVMESISAKHSHQWSDIHFKRLEEAYEPVASLLGVIK